MREAQIYIKKRVGGGRGWGVSPKLGGPILLIGLVIRYNSASIS